MAKWTSEELDKIGKAVELDVSFLGKDGKLRKDVTIWVVRIGDELFIRAVKGRGSWWFRGTQTRGMGHVRAGGVDKDVTFVEQNAPDVVNAVDEAYRAKYMKRWKASTESMLTAKAREATLKIEPR